MGDQSMLTVYNTPNTEKRTLGVSDVNSFRIKDSTPKMGGHKRPSSKKNLSLTLDLENMNLFNTPSQNTRKQSRKELPETPHLDYNNLSRSLRTENSLKTANPFNASGSPNVNRILFNVSESQNVNRTGKSKIKN